MSKKGSGVPDIVALKIRQWLPSWDDVKYDDQAFQAKPEPHFYLFSMRASSLKALTGVYRRSIEGGRPRAKDPNVQRGHEVERSKTIREFVQFGFPWCEMGKAKRKVEGAMDLRKPGWLPTAIVVNILESGAKRNARTIPTADLVTIEDRGDTATIILPKNFTGSDWEPNQIYPLEVIDGQHRLWAFEEFDPGDEFELPVVAFHGLDRSWQAYLFWSINITPKKINRSLAFDLYPLLRREDWLDKFAGHAIYRETRCQELVEALWSHPDSPWYQRINMLGQTSSERESDVPMVSQAAWIRSLMASFVKEWVEHGERIGGLFGAPRSEHDPFLPWRRAMQAAFLISAGRAVRDQVLASNAKWAQALRKAKATAGLEKEDDEAFYGKHSLLTTDQGIRGVLFVVNDLCYVSAAQLELSDWQWEDIEARTKRSSVPATDEQAVTAACESLEQSKAGKFLNEIAKGLASYDWRTSAGPELSEQERLRQAVFRGSSGYKELRRQLLAHIAQGKGAMAQAAQDVSSKLGYSWRE